MPMHDVGYRKWKGELTSWFARWWMIATAGISIAYRSQWIKRMMLAAWLPVIGLGIAIFVFETYLGSREQDLNRMREIADEAGIDIEDREMINEMIEAHRPSRNSFNGSMSREEREERRDKQRRAINESGEIWKLLSEKEVDHNQEEIQQLRALLGDFPSLLLVDPDRLQQLVGELKDAEDEEEFGEITKRFLSEFASEDFKKTIANLNEGEVAKKLELSKKLASMPEADRNFFLMRASQLFGQRFRDDIMDVEIIPIVYREKFADAFTASSNHEARKLGWSCYLLFFLGNSQGIMTIILIALIVPPLISRDLRSRAYFIYFAKPIGRWEYLLGKFSIPAVFLILVTTVPALGLFLFAIAMSPDLMVVFDTWDLPFRVFVASATMIIPTVSLALMLSSMTQESRFATFAWFAIWILPGGAYLVMRGIKQGIDNEILDPNWTLISLFQMINNVQSWIFGVSPMNTSVAGGIILLTALTIGCWAVLYRRVSAPVNI